MSKSATYQVVHETEYKYAGRVNLSYHIGHLRPLEDAGQTVEQFFLDISPVPAHHSNDRDSFSNARVFFAIYSPHQSLKVRAESRIRVVERFEGLDESTGPPWEEARDALHYHAGVAMLPQGEFAFASPYVPVHAELRAYALESFTPGRALVAASLELMHRIHSDFSYETDSTEVTTTALEAFRLKHGVCQDFAHVMIGCLRSLGLAARYVSGYLRTYRPGGAERLVGADASHAWVAVHSPALLANGGWLELDPTNDRVPACDHVALAMGRDYGDITPLRGTILGGGENTLRVAVSVMPVADQG